MELKFTSIVVDNALATWVSTKPGLIYQHIYCCRRFVKVQFFLLDMLVFALLPLCIHGSIMLKL